MYKFKLIWPTLFSIYPTKFYTLMFEFSFNIDHYPLWLKIYNYVSDVSPYYAVKLKVIVKMKKKNVIVGHQNVINFQMWCCTVKSLGTFVI